MTLVTPTQVNPGDDITANSVNAPVNEIAAVVNGNIDDTNVSTISGSKLANGTVSADKLTDSGWQNLTGGSGFTSVGAQCRKIGNIVYLRGQIDKNSGNIASSETLTTTPAGFRPASIHAFVGVGAGPSFTKMLVNTNGTIASASTPSSTTAYMRIDNVMFTVD